MDNPVDYLVLPLCLPLCCAVKNRGDIREKYGIAGDLVTDIVTLYCCGPCAMTQQTRELIDNGKLLSLLLVIP